MLKNLKLNAIKALLLALVPFLIHVKMSAAGALHGIQWPDLSTVFPTIQAKAAAVLVYYELLVRLVPSVENNSLIRLLGQLLNAVAPNHALTDTGDVGLHDTEDVVNSFPGAGGTGLAPV